MIDIFEGYQDIFSHRDHFGELVGYRLLEIEPGRARTCLTVAEKHISPSGAMHGGVLSTFVDFAMGASIFKTLKKGERCSTIEFKINYLSPVKLKETILCEAKVKFMGKSHAVTEAHVFRTEGKDIAVAIGTYNIYRQKV